MDLFSLNQNQELGSQPLAEQLRPKKLEEMLGQAKIVGEKAPWRRLVESGQIPSLILWGPPGSGKTTFALLLAQKVDAEFVMVNAVETGAKALRELGDAGRRRRLEFRRKTLVFIDEIHRLNKGQQDVLLPSVEKGDIILVGATTENPSYEINAALLSRCRLVVFERLGENELATLAKRAAERSLAPTQSDLANEKDHQKSRDDQKRDDQRHDEIKLSERPNREEGADSDKSSTSGPFGDLNIDSGGLNVATAQGSLDTTGASEVSFAPLNQVLTNEALSRLVEFADGDGRKMINLMETILEIYKVHQPSQAAAPDHSARLAATNALGDKELPQGASQDSSLIQWPLQPEMLEVVLEAPGIRYDKTADEHYDTVSAFIKSVRGSDPDAAVYYLARMIKGGEDPVFIARRLVILASEDIGNADPRALTLAISGLQAVELVGWPEAAISLAQVATYLASAPKSNRSYMALKAAQELVATTGTVPIPLALRSAKTTAMKNLGYGKGYKYSHDGAKGYIPQSFLPAEIGDVKFYEPTDHGFEKNIRQYLEWLKSK